MSIYENCPIIENEKYRLRLTEKADCDDLLEIYSDKFALPFFNSDNCNGDNFYYATSERMSEAIDFWIMSYRNRWFARLTIEERAVSKVIGTVELCLRASDDAFDGMGILRVDVKSEYEKEDVLYDIFSLITPYAYELLGCSEIITKAPIYAVERINAIKRLNYERSKHLLVGGHDGQTYNGYWTVKK